MSAITTLYNIEDASRGLDIVRTLFEEYISELSEDLQFQNYSEELEDPLKKYGPPDGALLLAYYDNEAAGCVALQKLDDEVCEMKRLYVRPAFRERGIGEELVTAILEEAKQKGYKKMVLDTLERLQPAIRLYQNHGFLTCSPYYDNPLTGVAYMEKMLED